MNPLPPCPLDPSAIGSPIAPQILRVPLRLLRFRQAVPEHGCGGCPQPIGEATPPGHRRFRSTSE